MELCAVVNPSSPEPWRLPARFPLCLVLGYEALLQHPADMSEDDIRTVWQQFCKGTGAESGNYFGGLQQQVTCFTQ